MAETKAVCGGFIVGEGLEMNGKVLSATGGEGGGIRLFNIERLPDEDLNWRYYIIHGISMETIKNSVYYLHGPILDENEIDTLLFGYFYMKPDEEELEEGIWAMTGISAFTFSIFGSYLDGVKVGEHL